MILLVLIVLGFVMPVLLRGQQMRWRNEQEDLAGIMKKLQGLWVGSFNRTF